jgi:hypothetical protein
MGTPEAELDAQARRLHAIDLARYRLRVARNPSPNE